MPFQRIAFATLVALLGVSTAATGKHSCIHDTPAFQREMEDLIEANRGLVKVPRSFNAEAVGPLRVHVVSDNVDDSSKYCTAAGQTRPSFSGSEMKTCTTDDIFSTSRKAALMDNIIPRARGVLAKALSVSQTATLQFAGSCGANVIKPASISSPGVSADFILFVTAGATGGSTIAWAKSCANNAVNRPVVGQANFGPKYLVWDTNDRSSRHEVVATAVHELLHALGFSGSRFTSSMKGSATVRGKTVTQIISPTVVSEVRSFYGCSTVAGLEIEDEGGSGSAGSHWDRRLAPYEMMAAAGGETLSRFTLALLKDLNVGYTVNMAVADPLYFGKNAGCSFFTADCGTTSGGQGTWFCGDKSRVECTDDATEKAYCNGADYTSDLPTHFQHFTNPKFGGKQFLDFCPVIQGFSNGLCETGTFGTDERNVYGTFYGKKGKCFKTNNVINSGFTLTVPGAARCYETNCASATQLDVRVGGGAWMSCTAKGQTLTVSSSFSSGTMICPDPVRVCDPTLWKNGEDLGLLDTVIGVQTPAPEVADSDSDSDNDGTPAPVTPAPDTPSPFSPPESPAPGAGGSAASVAVGVVGAVMAALML